LVLVTVIVVACAEIATAQSSTTSIANVVARLIEPFISLCRCCVERKRGRIRRVKHWKPTLAILMALSASLAVADDFKTTNGKEYKNATVTRVEPDGIVVKSKSGISKVYFVELPKEVQERFHYNPEKAAAAQTAAAQQAAEINKQAEESDRQRNEASKQRQSQLAEQQAKQQNIQALRDR
jgi:hypothetical protein